MERIVTRKDYEEESAHGAVAGGFWKRLIIVRRFLRGTICLLPLGPQPLQGPQDLLAGGYLLRFLAGVASSSVSSWTLIVDAFCGVLGSLDPEYNEQARLAE